MDVGAGTAISCAEHVLEEELPRELARSQAFAGKGPRSWEPEEDEDMEEGSIQEGDEPDLATFFSMFPWVEEASQIAMCRTYANYLANKIKAKKPRVFNE